MVVFSVNSKESTFSRALSALALAASVSLSKYQTVNPVASSTKSESAADKSIVSVLSAEISQKSYTKPSANSGDGLRVISNVAVALQPLSPATCAYKIVEPVS